MNKLLPSVQCSPFFGVLVVLFFNCISANSQQQSAILYEDPDGALTYIADSADNRIPDFSYAGYRGGLEALPSVPTVMALEPIEGDDTQQIQDALDMIGAMPISSNGLRGAVLLSPGIYQISNPLNIRESGVVLRGTGDGQDPDSNSILICSGPDLIGQTVVVMGNQGWSWQTPVFGTITAVVNPFLPSGSRTLEVENAGLFPIGAEVVLVQPSTQKWLTSIDNGGTATDEPWSPGEIDIYYHRTIVATYPDQNKVVLDAPVYDHLERSLSSTTLYIPVGTGKRTNLGLEDLRIEIVASDSTGVDHARTGVAFRGVEDCWAENITISGFSFAGVDMTVAKQVTVTGCNAIDPVGPIDGGLRYNFNVSRYSNNILFTNCFATFGRHSFVSNGASSASGIVFQNSTSSGDYNTSEGHRRWSQGLLLDKIDFVSPNRDLLVGLYNRGDYGTGHGWSSVSSVAWNITVPTGGEIVIQRPPNRMNYAIGCKGIVTNVHRFIHPAGHIELTGSDPEFESLYDKQLQQRREGYSILDAPARVEAETDSDSLRLTWLDIAAEETGYVVEGTDADGNTTEVLAELEGNTTSIVLAANSIDPATVGYRVYAVADTDRSAKVNAGKSVASSSVDPSADDQLSIRIIPNPATSEISVFSALRNGHLRVFSVSGELVVYSKEPTAMLDISELTPGYYLIDIVSDSGQRGQAPFIKL